MQCEERRSVMINALVNETEHDRCMISDLVINSDHRTRCENRSTGPRSKADQPVRNSRCSMRVRVQTISGSPTGSSLFGHGIQIYS